MTNILHLVRNSVSYDSRVLKESGAILDRYPQRKLTVAGLHEPGCPEQEIIGDRQVHRWRLSTRLLPRDLLSQTIKFLEWQYRLLRAYENESLKVIHCHDLEPLPIAVRLARLTGAKLIYDAHELETERNGVRGLRRWISQWQERRLLPFVDHLITVSPSICNWYSRRYPSIPVSLVRNIPYIPELKSTEVRLRETFRVPEDALLFLYLGGLGSGRGVEKILESFANPNVLHHVLFMGAGSLLDRVSSYSKRCHRIHYLPPVPPHEVITYARGADVGLSLIEDTCLSYRYCLPNKLFESILSGLPVLASCLPDQAKIVRDHQAGWVIEPVVPALVAFLCQLDASAARGLRLGLAERTADLQWANEAAALLQVYEELL